MKLIPLLLVACLGSLASTGQIMFERLHKIDTLVEYNDIILTSDGGYAAVGECGGQNFNFTGQNLALVTKMDVLGDTMWTRTYDEFTFWRRRNHIVETNAGNYVFAGTSYLPNVSYGDRPAFSQIDANGDTLWRRAFNPTTIGQSYTGDLIKSNDGNIVVAGQITAVVPNDSSSLFLTKLNLLGDTIWSKKYGHRSNGQIHCVKQTADGGYILGGYIRMNPFQSNLSGLLLIKTDAVGDTLWTKQYNSSMITNYGYISDIVEVAGGYTATFSVDAGGWNHENGIMQVNSNGGVVWSKLLRRPNTQNISTSIVSNANGYAIAGTTTLSFGNQAMYLAQLDFNGDTLWTKGYQADISGVGPTNSEVRSMKATNDGGYILAGLCVQSGFQYQTRGYIVKTDDVGNSGCATIHPGLETATISFTENGAPLPVKASTPIIPFGNDAMSSGISDSTICGTQAAMIVWPGDANFDGTANNLDYLYIGLANDSIGAPRASQSTAWTAFPATPWVSDFVTADNYAHADCDGNGQVQAGDTIATINNYDQVHSTPPAVIDSATVLNAPIYFVAADSVGASDQVIIDVYAGTNSLPVNDLHGVAFTISYDTSLVEQGSVQISFPNSWIGTPGNDVWAMSMDNYDDGEIDIALTRFDLQDQSGFGKIAVMAIVMPDDISLIGDQFSRAESEVVSDTLRLDIKDVLALSSVENAIPLYRNSDSIVVYQLIDGVQEVDLEKELKLYPNPTNAILNVEMKNSRIVEYRILNLLGQEVQTESVGLQHNISIDTQSIPKGSYLISIQTENGLITKLFQRL